MTRRLFAIFLSIALVGMSQGLLVPLLALLLEQRGAGALFNGLSTTVFYLGFVLASPFIEASVRRYGTKRTLIGSAWLSLVATLAFPMWDNPYAWLFFRLVLGTALSGLFVATEIWLNRLLTPHNRGRMFALYGLFIAFGLAIGPLGINLADLSLALPFVVSALSYLIPIWLTWRADDQGSYREPSVSETAATAHVPETGWQRWWRIFAFAPFAILAAFVYGYLDGAMVGTFPIYGSRIGMDDTAISLALTIFVGGSIVFQFPLGYLSDTWGRRKTLITAAGVGAIGFLLLPLLVTTAWLLLIDLFLIGAALGSFYSLGLAYMGDRLSSDDITSANALYIMNYGIGSLLGPAITGSLIAGVGRNSFAWSILVMLLVYALFGLFHKAKRESEFLFKNKDKAQRM
ncbi:MAG TPA: MFS transporter [Bacilli bacterium]|nr:MFS transporter [Bacilli bacterium]